MSGKREAWSASAREVYALLDKRFNGALLRAGENGYEDARSVWNGMVSRSPQLIARCADVN